MKYLYIAIAIFLVLSLVITLFILGTQRQASKQITQPFPENFLPKTESTDDFHEIPLEIRSPKDSQLLSGVTVTVSGKTVPNADVSVNDTYLKSDGNGEFSVVVTLEEGDYEITVTANDENGNFAEKSVNILLP